jgi:hypothetical protein
MAKLKKRNLSRGPAQESHAGGVARLRAFVVTGPPSLPTLDLRWSILASLREAQVGGLC